MSRGTLAMTQSLGTELNGSQECIRRVHKNLGKNDCQMQKSTETHLRPLKVFKKVLSYAILDCKLFSRHTHTSYIF